jgi:hypothetical protein
MPCFAEAKSADICLPSRKIDDQKLQDYKTISPTNGPHSQSSGAVKIVTLFAGAEHPGKQKRMGKVLVRGGGDRWRG